jgi:hypothetical protein
LMWIKNSNDHNEQEPLTALTALGLGQTMFGQECASPRLVEVASLFLRRP